MSRSYHRGFWRTDKSFANRTLPKHYQSKTIANHKVRQQNKRALMKAIKTDIDNLSIPQHKQYRKQYDSWEIVDYKFRYRPEYEDAFHYWQFRMK